MGSSTELDKDLANGLTAAKSKRCFFVLVLKGGTDGALLVSKTKIAAPAIAEAKKKSGGSAVLSGFVSYADGAYLFETAKLPPATAAQAAKTIAKRDAEVSIHAVFRLSTDPELLASEGVSPETAKTPPLDGRSPSEAAYQERVKALLEDLKKAIASRTEAGNEAKIRFSESQLFARKKEFEQALTLLDAVEVQIKKALEEAPAAPSGMRRLNNLMPAIKAAISAGGPNAARIQTLLAAATGLIKNDELIQAEKVLDELEPLLNPSAGSGAVDLTAEWKKKLADWTPAIKAAIVAKGPNAAAISKLMAQASAMSKPGGDMVEALAKLTECHDLATAGVAQKPDAVKPDAVKSDAAKSDAAKSDTAAKEMAGDAPSANPEAAYNARVKSLTEDLKKAINSGTPAGNEAKLRFSQSQVLARKKDFAQATPLLDIVEDQIKQALGGTDGATVTADALIAFQARWKPIRGEWQEASQTVDGQISQLQHVLLSKNDPELKRIAEFGLNGLTGDFKAPLLGAMLELEAATPQNLKSKAAKVGAIAAAFQAHLMGNAKGRVGACDRNPYGVTMTVRDLLVPALTEVQTTLATAATG